jgi:hypothetical protein
MAELWKSAVKIRFAREPRKPARPLFDHNYQHRAPIERLVEHLHELGPRALAEFLSALSIELGIGSLIVAKLHEYGQIDPILLAAVRGDRFAPPPLRSVSS